MKRLFSITLLCVFIFSTVGVIASSYSCPMMKKASAKMCCTSGCCKRDVKLLKVKDDFLSPNSISLEKNLLSSIILFTPVFTENYLTYSKNLFSEDDHAPPGKIIDRLSFIQSFLI